ncbi:MAG: prolipoprotein diacylglyceryl transferase [Clostridiales bacterium]|jgi:phosphatidylglycerol:prolipoprotein diacylglycerol transferase|nr:prolipoprotein diacylglyceryl transferase [Clostridiales bacterium]
MDQSIAFYLGSWPVRWYGILISGSMAIAIWLAYRQVVRQHLNPDEVFNIAFWAIPSAVIGARLYYVIFQWGYFSSHPQDIVKIWHGGMAIHGAIIAGILVTLLYCSRRKLDFWRYADIGVISLVIAQAIGRWGNYFNQEAYGYETDLPWAMFIDGAYRHPTFLYECIWNLLVFGALSWLMRRRHRSGSILASYLIFYSLGRAFIELLRTDSLMVGPIRGAVLVSAIGVLIGALILRSRRNQPMLDVYQKPEKAGWAANETIAPTITKEKKTGQGLVGLVSSLPEREEVIPKTKKEGTTPKAKKEKAISKAAQKEVTSESTIEEENPEAAKEEIVPEIKEEETAIEKEEVPEAAKEEIVPEIKEEETAIEKEEVPEAAKEEIVPEIKEEETAIEKEEIPEAAKEEEVFEDKEEKAKKVREDIPLEDLMQGQSEYYDINE